MVERKRDSVVHVRTLEVEAQMVAELAEHEGLTVSEWVRNIIRSQYALTFRRALPKPKRK